MCKEYPDNISFKDAAEFTMTVEGDFSKLFEVLGIEVPKKDDNLEELKNACETATEGIKAINQILAEHISKSLLDIRVKKEDIRNEDILAQIKDQETAELEKACEIAERYNACYNKPTGICYAESCMNCKHNTEPKEIAKALKLMANYVKKSLNDGEEVNNRYIHNVTGGVELYDDAHNYVGYVHGFRVSEENEAIIRSVVKNSWGLVTFNPLTLEKIIRDHGFVSDLDVTVEIYKDHVYLPKHGYYKSYEKEKEDSK